MSTTQGQDTVEAQLESATKGFDFLFNDDVPSASKQFASDSSAFHLLGTGVTSFLQAALGLEEGLMPLAIKSLTSAEAATRKQTRTSLAKSKSATPAFPPGMEWEVLQADAVVLLGLTQALSESYMGYLSCMYSLNSAHGKFTKLFKSVFPNGIDDYPTPATSRKPSEPDLASITTSLTQTTISTVKPANNGGGSFLGRWGLAVTSTSTSTLTPPSTRAAASRHPNGPVESLIVSGAAFGFGLFNLVFSLLPPKIKRLVGILGFQSDRQLALRALAVAARGSTDVHATFAALTLMTYHGVVLLLSGYQADEDHIVRQYRAVLEPVHERFPHGSLWLLNQAKLERYTYNPLAAIETLKRGLSPDKEHPRFQQADALLIFELAWIELAERRYADSAETFLRMKTVNSWSHPTYTFLAAGCYLSLRTPEAQEKAQQLFNTLPALLERKKIGGRDLPTEKFIRVKLEFYKRKQARRGGKEANSVDVIKISPAEELGIVWNTHGRISKEVAEAHITDLLALTPPIAFPSPYTAPTSDAASDVAATLPDLDTPDEHATRHLLLGILHHRAGHLTEARTFLEAADKPVTHGKDNQVKGEIEGRWVCHHAYFELAVLALKVAEGEDQKLEEGEDNNISSLEREKERWAAALKEASHFLDKSANGASNLDLGSRLESRIALLRDEMRLKKTMLQL